MKSWNKIFKKIWGSTKRCSQVCTSFADWRFLQWWQIFVPQWTQTNGFHKTGRPRQTSFDRFTTSHPHNTSPISLFRRWLDMPHSKFDKKSPWHRPTFYPFLRWFCFPDKFFWPLNLFFSSSMNPIVNKPAVPGNAGDAQNFTLWIFLFFENATQTRSCCPAFVQCHPKSHLWQSLFFPSITYWTTGLCQRMVHFTQWALPQGLIV